MTPRLLCIAIVLASAAWGCSTVRQYLPRQLLGTPATAKTVKRIVVLPLAYRSTAGTSPCDLCPDRLVMDVTSEDDARLVTAFLYEELSRHPRLQLVPYETVEATRSDSMRDTVARLAESEQVDAVLVGALLELRERLGDPRDPRQRAGASLYAALLELPSGRPVWKKLYDHTPGRSGRTVRQYERIVVGEESKAKTAHEVAQVGVARLVASLARSVR